MTYEVLFDNLDFMDRSKMGDLIKTYQSVTNIALPAHGYNILQLDGKAFHTFTRGFERPFDSKFVEAMNQTAIAVLNTVSSAKFAYVQSDEISILLKTTHPEEGEFFNNRVQKVVSIVASVASVTLSNIYQTTAIFDARFFAVPDADTAAKHFIWRQRDCTKNSIQSVAQAHFSPAQLHGKNSLMLKEMLQEAGDPWEAYPDSLKHGRLIRQKPAHKTVHFTDKRTKEPKIVEVETTEWVAEGTQRFEESRILDTLIPEPFTVGNEN